MTPELSRVQLRSTAVWFFVLVARATLAVAFGVSRKLLPQADVLSAAVAVDLLVTLPLLFLGTVVLSGRARPAAALVIVVAGGLITRLLVPQAISWAGLGVILALAELAVISMAVTKLCVAVRRLRLSADGSSDLTRVIRDLVTQTIGPSLVGRIVAADFTLISYALVGWWMNPEVPENAEAVDSGAGSISISIGLGLAVLAEAVALHPVLWKWHPAGAIIHGLLALWALLWILGDINGLRLRPSYVDGNRLVLRQGLRWQIEVPLDGLKTRRAEPDDLDHRSPDRLDLAVGDGPTHVLELEGNITAHGLFRDRGFREVAVRFEASAARGILTTIL